jgi:myb proto-oncogene protein
MRGSISLDNEAVPIELRGTDSANNAVGTNRIMDPVSVGEEGVVQKRTSPSKPARGNSAEQKIMTGSIPVGIEAVPIELRGTVSTNNEVGTNTMMDPVSIGDGGVVKKRTTRSKPAGSEGATRKRRCSISADNEAGTNMMRDPVSGEEGVVKKRMRRSKPVGNYGAARKTMRASVPVGDEGVVKKRTGSVTTENHGGVTKRKRAPSRWHFHATVCM